MLADRDDDWMARSTCKDTVDADDIFFPAKQKGRPVDYEIAREICNRCLVFRECLAYAVYHRERYGMWGGLTPAERRSIPIDARRKLRKWWIYKYGRR